MANVNIKTGTSEFPDYYEVLQCERTASSEELKKSYQSLILSTHPDKVNCNNDRFLLVQEAWNILRDPESRKLYDAQLSNSEHSNTDCLLYDVINLSDMDNCDGVYTYMCRCGSNYVLEDSDRPLKREHSSH
ncbi:hypothetical protein MSG28_003338 [Choristoneura fumiferana]|uniref:Uncharacterized protein n=1 Tax=Choristoneura fumiferana TaxID=7141 RepID=A0ACC0KE81_CHOFU|nr:hypothetical protein MSG28_003338 [Choristoneura fumiferana]